MHQRKPTTTYVLIGINVAVFLIESLFGGSENVYTALRFGALYVPYVQYGQWWRFLTSMFLHFGIQHLGSNMISLFAVGPYVELYYGRIRYLVIYFVSGLCGGLLTYYTEVRRAAAVAGALAASGQGTAEVSSVYAVSAGASGAIFGLLGVFLIFAMMPGLRRAFPLRRVLMAIILSLLPAVSDPSISMTAHLGGLAGGFVTAGIMTVLHSGQRRLGERQG